MPDDWQRRALIAERQVQGLRTVIMVMVLQTERYPVDLCYPETRQAAAEVAADRAVAQTHAQAVQAIESAMPDDDDDDDPPLHCGCYRDIRNPMVCGSIKAKANPFVPYRGPWCDCGCHAVIESESNHAD